MDETKTSHIGLDSSGVMDFLGKAGSPIISLTELIKNSIDANSTDITVSLSTNGENLIEIKDNGDGFSKKDLDALSKPGNSQKLINNSPIRNKYGMPIAGCKGVGILSCFEICSSLKISTTHQEPGDGFIHKYTLELEKENGTIKGPNEEIVGKEEKTGTLIVLNGVADDIISSLASKESLSALAHFTYYPYQPQKENISLPKVVVKVGLETYDLIPDDLSFPGPCLYNFHFSFVNSDKDNSGRPSITFWFENCNSVPNLEKHTLTDFSFSGLKSFLRNDFKIGGTTKTPPEFKKIGKKEGLRLDGMSAIPNFVGNIVVYHKDFALASEKIKRFGYGVGEYVNGYILYSSLDQNVDWIGVNKMIQNVKYANLFSRAMYGYINIPDFKETKTKFEISTERDKFRELPAYTLMLSLIRGFVVGVLFNIDVFEMAKRKRQKDVEDSAMGKDDSSAQRQAPSISSDADTTFSSTGKESENLLTGNAENRDSGEKIKFPTVSDVKEDCLAIYDDSEGKALKEGLENEIKNGGNNLRECSKIYRLLSEISRIKYKDYPCSCILLFRSLIDVSSGLLAKKCGLKNQDAFYQSHSAKKLIDYISYVLNDEILSKLNQHPNETSKKLKAVFNGYVLNLGTFISAANELFVHGKDVPDLATVFGSWAKVRSFVSFCVSPETSGVCCPLQVGKSPSHPRGIK